MNSDLQQRGLESKETTSEKDGFWSMYMHCVTSTSMQKEAVSTTKTRNFAGIPVCLVCMNGKKGISLHHRICAHNRVGISSVVYSLIITRREWLHMPISV